jgi:hypothetical protein
MASGTMQLLLMKYGSVNQQQRLRNYSHSISLFLRERLDMFEFYGWACISSDTYEVNDEADAQLVAQLQDQLSSFQQPNVVVHVAVGLNGWLNALSVMGSTNHRYQPIIDLFEWLAEHGPGSYGLLYVQDKEDYRRTGDYQEVFRVWRLARGTLHELDDPFLSPRIPTIEDPYDPVNRPD